MRQISYAGGVRMHFLQKYERYTGKNTSADRQIFNFSKMAWIAFLKILSLRPFISLSGLLKLELLSSDSFYCQGALKTSFRREITIRCTLRTIRVKSKKTGDITEKKWAKLQKNRRLELWFRFVQFVPKIVGTVLACPQVRILPGPISAPACP